jgi:hypothetical protein
MIFSNQYNNNNLTIATPAAPTQFTTIFTFFAASFSCKGERIQE